MKLQVKFLALGIILAACSTLRDSATADASSSELWSRHCSRCHNIPNPKDHTPAEWDVVGAHMRQRANISSEEIEKIISFLKTLHNVPQ